MKKVLEALVVEQLLDQEMPIDEAYAHCDDLLNKGRIRDYFQGKLDDLNWEKIEIEIKKVQEERL